jgi:N-acetylmuramic acid 6-phosphate etherase
MGLNPKDIVIGIAASGTTPFVLSAIKHARQKGVWTCGIANNKGTPVLAEAEHAILLDTGPEILTGSTRLKAGTAQKMCLNRISTGAMVLNGKVIENNNSNTAENKNFPMSPGKGILARVIDFLNRNRLM